MSLRTILAYYAERLRAHPLQELLAGAGIVIGVALTVAVLIADTSVSAGGSELVAGIAGNATQEVSARSSDGFSAGVLDAVRSLPGVAVASPLLEQRALVVGPSGRRSVQLVGADRSLLGLHGQITRSVDPLELLRGVMPARDIATGIGIGADAPYGTRIHVLVRGRLTTARVSEVLDRGSIAGAFVVAGELRAVQQLAGLPGRITNMVVASKPGQDARVHRELVQLAGGRLAVTPVSNELRLLDEASRPSDQATGVFAAVAAIVGFLLAANAMLLTAPERRRAIATLRTAARVGSGDIARMVVLEAALLGAVASAVGVVAGIVLAHLVFTAPPSFLSFAFALGDTIHVPIGTVLLVATGGVLATITAAAPPLLDLRPGRDEDAVLRDAATAGQRLPVSLVARLAIVGLSLLAGTSVVLLLAPAATIVGLVGLGAATVLVVPAVGVLAGAGARWIADRTRLPALAYAADALRAEALRPAALAAMGAVAVFGTVAIVGARHDLLTGLDANFRDYLRSGDLWITTGGDENSLTTEPFTITPAKMAALRGAPGVAGVRPYAGSFLDLGDRRAWVIARDATDPGILPASQLVAGNPRTARARMRAGGWVALSQPLAHELHAHVGGPVTLPTPTGPVRLRLAAGLTNLGWGPGAIVLNLADYQRAWHTTAPTALQVTLAPGADPTTTAARLQALVGGGTLRVQTRAQRDEQYRQLARDGLQRLEQIAELLTIAAAAALAAGAGGALWQRRRAVAALALSGVSSGAIWRSLMLETGLMLGTGCLTGAAAGLWGHRLLDIWLSHETGYPAPASWAGVQVVEVLAGVLLSAMLAIALIGEAIARVPARLATAE